MLYVQGVNNLAKEICLRTQICNSGSKRACEHKSLVLYQGFNARLLNLEETLGSKKGSRIDSILKDYIVV